MSRNEGTGVGTRGNEAVRLRAALRQAETRHRSALAKATEQREDAVERAAELQREVDRLNDLVDDLERQLEQRVDDANHLRSECARLENQWQEREDDLEEDHRQMMAEVARAHERELLEALELRDGAVAEAERAAEGAALARLEIERLTRALEDERHELDELLLRRTAEGQRRYEAVMQQLDAEQTRATRLADERDRALAELALGGRATPSCEMASVLAQHDDFIAELLESHEREIATARREHDITRAELEVAMRQLTEIEITAGRRRAASSRAAENAEMAHRWASTVERIESRI